MRHAIASIAAAAVLLPAGTALAVDGPAVAKARDTYFEGIGKTNKGLMEGLKAAHPDLGALRAYAARLDAEAPKLPSLFPPGTGRDAGLKTGAKPEIWRKPAEFKRDAAAFAAAAQRLDRTAQLGDLAKIKLAAGDLGEACKTCHQSFRQQSFLGGLFGH